MYKKVETWIDIPSIERKTIQFWQDSKVFNELLLKNVGGPKWSFIDGPITANNPMGVHHAWGRTLKDTFHRYWAMNGYEIRYQNGFDCQGLWVEVEVEKELGFNSKRQIEDYGVGNFINLCKDRVNRFADIITNQSKRLGYWMAWENSYFTMSDENNYMIWHFLKKCHQRGKLYRGTDVMPWSGRSETGYSQMEVVEGRKLTVHEAFFVKFPLKNRPKENLLIWTTTPWTLPANVAVAVNPTLYYVRIQSKLDDEIYYVAEENFTLVRKKKEFDEGNNWVEGVPKLKSIAQIFEDKGGYTICGKILGQEMIDWEYIGPFDELEAQQETGGFPFKDKNILMSPRDSHRVIDGGRDSRGEPVVVVGEGTGLVHIAPGCGDIDHSLGVSEKLPIIAPLDTEAKFINKFGPFTGRHALDETTTCLIRESLIEKNVLFSTEKYPHIYPHCWRSGDPLVFRLVDEWYIKMDWRDDIKEIVNNINWIPSWGKEREIEWLSNMRDWMISKKRFWGLALPIWVCEDCDNYQVIGGYEELRTKAIVGWHEFEGRSPHRPWIDSIKIRCEKCGGLSHRVPDVGNPWLDAGIVPYSTLDYLKDRKKWNDWVPADLVLECFPGQFRNWFYSMLAMSTMLENVRPFKNLVGHASVLDEKGNEMHKSLGNSILFDEAADQFGADIMRWIYIHQDYETDLLFGPEIIKKVRGGFFNTLWNCYAFYVNYAKIFQFIPSKDNDILNNGSLIDRWILSRLNNTIQESRNSYKSYIPRKACIAIESFVEDLSNWYIRQNRRRFWQINITNDKNIAYQTLYTCLHTLIRLLAPIIPFITEEMYQNLTKSWDINAPNSVHLTDYPNVNKSLINEKIEKQMDAVKSQIKMALSAREIASQKIRQPLSLLTVGPTSEIERQAAIAFSDIIKDQCNVKNLEIKEINESAPVQEKEYILKPNYGKIGKRLKKKLGEFKKIYPKYAHRLAQDYEKGKELFTIPFDGIKFEIGKDEFIVKEKSVGDLLVVQEGNKWISLDLKITEELQTEGLMREILHQLQFLRKNKGLEIEDRINLFYTTESELIRNIIQKYNNQLSDELLANIFEEDPSAHSDKLCIGKDKLYINLTKSF